jgi:hypothetical protein
MYFLTESQLKSRTGDWVTTETTGDTKDLPRDERAVRGLRCARDWAE